MPASPAMNFAKFSRRSLTVRCGYGIEATHKIQGIPLRPHARVGYGRELHTDPVRVSAGMNAMPGTSFSLDGLKLSADTAVLGVGAVAGVHEHAVSKLQDRNPSPDDAAEAPGPSPPCRNDLIVQQKAVAVG